MKDRQSDSLRAELKVAGATNAELNALVAVASRLKQLNKPKPEHQSRSRRATFIPASITALAGLVAGMALVIFSQAVLPNSWLYPVQKLSDSVAIAVHPQYRGTIMMRRAQQVQQLVASRASSRTVLATLADYQVEAAAYKSTSTNYAMFEYCKTSLRQAASIAPNPERQAINKALVSLTDV